MNGDAKREGQILIEQRLAESRVLIEARIPAEASGILASWTRGGKTLVQAQRELVALGLTPTEALNVLADAKAGGR
jgi:hypothetical protein